MTKSELSVDLRGQAIETLNDLWDAMSEPCGPPAWFGRNLDAWVDTIEARGVSDVIDSYEILIVHVDKQGLFDEHRQEANILASTFDGERNRLVVPTGKGQARWTVRWKTALNAFDITFDGQHSAARQ